MFALTRHHEYNMSDIENMFPFERDIIVDLLLAWIEEQKEKNANS